MRQPSREAGFLLVDLIVGLALFGFVLLAIYQLYGSTFSVSRDINNRLAAQQDVRLTLDRVARPLRETTLGFGRFRAYPADAGCSGAYEGCVGFVTARDTNCMGDFQLIDGAPNWQATMYLWLDTASNELRLRCDPGTTFPAVAWPPPRLEPYAVVGTHVVAASVTLQPAGTLHRASIAIAIREQVLALGSRPQLTFSAETTFLPQNP